MTRPKLIDTSAWIDFFKGREPVASAVDAALADGTAALCGMVELELLAGLREREQDVLELLSALQRLETSEEDYRAAGVMLQTLRRRGVTVAGTDGLIAQVAKRHGPDLIEKDKHFKYFSFAKDNQG